MRHRYRLWVIVFATFFVAVGLTLLRGDGQRHVSLMPSAQADDGPADDSDSHAHVAEHHD